LFFVGIVTTRYIKLYKLLFLVLFRFSFFQKRLINGISHSICRTNTVILPVFSL